MFFKNECYNFTHFLCCTIIKLKFMKKIILSLLLFVSVNYSSAQWSSGNTNFPYSLFDVSFHNPSFGFAVGEQGSVLRTTDFGQNWEVVLNVPGKWFTSVHHFGPTSIIACGSYGAVYLSVNSGDSWTENSFPDFTKHLRSIKLAPTGQVWTVGYDGAFYISPSPNVWFPPVTQIPFTMHSIDFSPQFIFDLTAIIAATDGRVYRTSNSGTNWSYINLNQYGIYDYLNSVKFLTNNIAIIVGNNGRILKTTNAGLTWVNKNHMLTSEHLRDVDAVFNGANYTVVAVGDNGTILRSADDGETWTLQTMMPATTRHLYGVALPSLFNGYIVGEIGSSATAAFFMSSTFGAVNISNVSSTVPDKYELSQNYPNPFNPETKIKFSVLNSELVRLSVFDMLGREVKTLVNEKLAPGQYEYTFNGSGLNSGTYFYKLTSGSFTETKKMLLIK